MLELEHATYAGIGRPLVMRFLLLLAGETIPVSYTHLDVYKRQILGDPAVRKALQHATDRQTISDGIFYGLELSLIHISPRRWHLCAPDGCFRGLCCQTGSHPETQWNTGS